MVSVPPHISFRELKSRYQLILFDAYGVLLNADGVLPGAAHVLQQLNHENFPYFIVTNGSVKPIQKSVDYLKHLGLEVPLQNYISSGEVTRQWLTAPEYQSARVCLLGPSSCEFMLAPSQQKTAAHKDFDILVIGNQDGYEILQTINQAISSLYRMIDAGHPPLLVLPNPDLIYPAGNKSYGITSGMIANMLEAALKLRYQQDAPKFKLFGKPESCMFNLALERAELTGSPEKAVMIGDQIDTDIQGGKASGCDTALIGTGIADYANPQVWANSNIAATYLLRNLM
ncbi:MAG: HAD-IIA family hydrolase [Zetaproteobacteria bacterium]|nr:HAD-IIA family hydrolase [Zetaproteobacteria bacterium]